MNQPYRPGMRTGWTLLAAALLTISASSAALAENVSSETLSQSTVWLEGVRDNAGQVLTLDADNIWRFGAGSVLEGIIHIEEGTDALVVSTHHFHALRLEGDLGISGLSAVLRLTGGLDLDGTLTGKLRIDGTQTIDGGTINGATLGLDGNTTLALGENHTLRGSATVGYSGFGDEEGRVLINQGTIGGDSDIDRDLRIGLEIDQFTNHGLVQVTAGNRIIIGARQWSNTGTLEVLGGEMRLAGVGWVNDGTIRLLNGQLTFDGPFTTAGLGNLERTGGTVVMRRTARLDNTDAVFTLDASTGSWRSDGGTIEHGTVRLIEGATIIPRASLGNTTLHDVRLEGTLTMDEFSTGVSVTGGLDLDGTIHLAGTHARLHVLDEQVVTGAGTILLEGIGTREVVMNNGASLTLGPELTIRGQQGIVGGTGGFGGANRHLVNQGTIRADIPDPNGIRIRSLTNFTNDGLLEARSGGRLLVESADWTNEGVIQTVDGFMTLGGNWVNNAQIIATDAELTLNGNWTNLGTIDATDATVNLGGSFATADLSDFNRTRGIVNLTGTLDNTGQTLQLDQMGSWQLGGGTIQGGTVQLGGITNAMLRTVGGQLSHLIDVSIAGNLMLTGEQDRVRLDNVDFQGIAVLSGSRARFEFMGTQSLDAGTILFDHASPSNRPAIRMASSGTLTLGEDVHISGGHGTIGVLDGSSSPEMELINHGTIAADVAGRSIVVDPRGGLTNHGTLRAINGAHLDVRQLQGQTNTLDLRDAGSRLSLSGDYVLNQAMTIADGLHLTLDGNWSNAISIELADGGELDLGGSFTAAGMGTFARTGGTVNLTGTLDNTGGTLGLDEQGTWHMRGGTIQGGIVQLGEGPDATLHVTSQENRLIDVSLVGDVHLTSGQRLQFQDVTLDGTITLDGSNARIEFLGTQSFDRGTIVFDSGPFSAAPAMRMAIPGTLTLGTDVLVRGGNGRIDAGFGAALELVNHGTMAIDQPGIRTIIAEQGMTSHGSLHVGVDGRLDVVGDLELGGSHALTVGVRELSAPGHITVAGKAMLHGTLEFDLSGSEPLARSFDLLRADTFTGEFESVNVIGLPGTWGTTLEYEDDRVVATLALQGDLNADGAFDAGDVAPLVLALTNRAAYEAQYGVNPTAGGDLNGDGLFDAADIAPLVALLVGSTSGSTVPEPGSLVMLAVVALLLGRRAGGSRPHTLTCGRASAPSTRS